MALPFLILSFKFLEEKNYRLLAVSSLVILFLHRTTAIIYFLALGIYAAIYLARQRKYKLLGTLSLSASLLALAGYHFLNLQPLLAGFLANKNTYVTNGLFMENAGLLGLWWPVIVLALPGIFLYFKNRQHLMLPIFTALLLGWIAFKLPFYRRTLLYLDLCLIAYAAYFLSSLNYSKRSAQFALAAIFAALLYYSAGFALTQRPLIASAEIAEIKNFRQSPGFILTTTANDAPWLAGFAQDQRVGAPGLMEDPHTFEDWQKFWSGDIVRHFLSAYPRPLYLYQRSYQLPPNTTVCLVPLSANFSQLDYDCLEKNF
jgi:hypothetical protein